MRVLIITPYKKYSGGVETVNKNLEAIMREKNITVEYLTLEDCKYNKNNFLIKLIGNPYYISREYRRIDKSKYNLVICNGEYGFGVKHDHIINIFHGSYYGLYNNTKQFNNIKKNLWLLLSSLIQRIASKDKYVVAVSGYLKEVLSYQKIKVDQIIENGIDLEQFYPNYSINRDKYLFVGSYDYFGKGIDLIDSLRNKGYEIVSITNKTDSKNKMYKLGVENDEMVEVYNNYKMLIFPSRFESSGLVALEAMACGLPIIMNNVGIGKQLKKIIPEFVVDMNCDTETILEEYQKRIEFIESNYKHFSEIARKFVEDYYDISIFRQAWTNLLDDFIKNNK